MLYHAGAQKCSRFEPVDLAETMLRRCAVVIKSKFRLELCNAAIRITIHAFVMELQSVKVQISWAFKGYSDNSQESLGYTERCNRTMNLLGRHPRRYSLRESEIAVVTLSHACIGSGRQQASRDAFLTAQIPRRWMTACYSMLQRRFAIYMLLMVCSTFHKDGDLRQDAADMQQASRSGIA